MRAIPPALQAHLEGRLTTLALCWRLERRDGFVIRLTDHDRDLVVPAPPALAGTYLTDSGISGGNLRANSDGSVDNTTLQGFLRSTQITAADIEARLYDGARVDLFLLNWASPADGVVVLKSGSLGDITRSSAGQYQAELRGLSQRLQNNFLKTYSATCRAELGDALCQVNLAGFTYNGFVTEVIDSGRSFRDSVNASASGHFTNGVVTFTSGDNNTYKSEILLHTGGPATFHLALAMPNPIQVGDSFTAVAGCDKRLSTCRDKFNNVIRFRGEPYIPGADAISKGPPRSVEG